MVGRGRTGERKGKYAKEKPGTEGHEEPKLEAI